MIDFVCPSCDKPYSVPEQFAGRQARCKACGELINIPSRSQAAAAPAFAGPAKVTAAAVSVAEEEHAALPPRLRRLYSDYQQMRQAFGKFDLIHVKSVQGDPPEMYQLEYHVTGLEAGEKNKPVSRDYHRVEIQLPADYPRVAPLCRMITPIFHPNIRPSHICIADNWTAGERLPDVAIRIGEMIAFQSYNIKSPLDAVAAKWADYNAASLPVDARPLRPPDW